MKGEIEQRLKNVIDAVQQSPVPILLFIDEAHTLIGAGNQAGGADAANLLKPALARDERRTIAATTWSEYKQYFERDAALERRFQMINVDEPDDETALTLADVLYGGEKSLITINLSEYQEPHTVSQLKGSPPGYVGYGQGGILTEAVHKRPYSVVLLDEVEKAHRDLMNLFYLMFDRGFMREGEGREWGPRIVVCIPDFHVR